MWSKCWPENTDIWIQLPVSDFRQVQWHKLTHKNSYPHLICPCPGLFLQLSAGLVLSADTRCPFSHSAFETKLPHLCMKHLFTPRLVITSISTSFQCLHTAQFLFLSLLCSKIENWEDGQLFSTYLSLQGTSVKAHGILNMESIHLGESAISSPSG